MANKKNFGKKKKRGTISRGAPAFEDVYIVVIGECNALNVVEEKNLKNYVKKS